MSLEEQLWELLWIENDSKDAEAIDLLKSAPYSFNHNWINAKGHYKWGFLHLACCNNRHQMVVELLKSPIINLNLKDKHGYTPFIVACNYQAVECSLILLEDLRVDINCSTQVGDTGLMWLAHYGRIAAVEHILASIRHIPSSGVISAMKKARWNEKHSTALLLENFNAQPFETLKSLRANLNLQEYGPVTAFVLVILLSDDYLVLLPKPKSQPNPSPGAKKSRKRKVQNHQKLNPKNEKWIKARQFFEIALRLPMELQMVLCNRLISL